MLECNRQLQAGWAAEVRCSLAPLPPQAWNYCAAGGYCGISMLEDMGPIHQACYLYATNFTAWRSMLQSHICGQSSDGWSTGHVETGLDAATYPSKAHEICCVLLRVVNSMATHHPLDRLHQLLPPGTVPSQPRRQAAPGQRMPWRAALQRLAVLCSRRSDWGPSRLLCVPQDVPHHACLCLGP